MASTNKTANYNLSQFVGTDKPAWLSDYNQDMSKIDTGIKSAADTATGADGKADANAASIGTLSNLTTDEKTNVVSAINEVDLHADTAQNSANAANTTAIAANGKVDDLAEAFVLNNNLTYDKNNVTITGGTINSGEIYIARNATGSIFKLYNASMEIIPSGGSGTITITLPNTGIGTDTPYNIIGSGLSQTASSGFGGVNVTINNGSIQISFTIRANAPHYLRLFACLN